LKFPRNFDSHTLPPFLSREKKLQKNEAAEGGIKKKQVRLRAQFSAARVAAGFVCQ
jgi:hypothetical protein